MWTGSYIGLSIEDPDRERFVHQILLICSDLVIFLPWLMLLNSCFYNNDKSLKWFTLFLCLTFDQLSPNVPGGILLVCLDSPNLWTLLEGCSVGLRWMLAKACELQHFFFIPKPFSDPSCLYLSCLYFAFMVIQTFNCRPISPISLLYDDKNWNSNNILLLLC